MEDIALEDIALEDIALEDIALEDIALEDIALRWKTSRWKTSQPDRNQHVTETRNPKTKDNVVEILYDLQIVKASVEREYSEVFQKVRPVILSQILIWEIKSEVGGSGVLLGKGPENSARRSPL